MNRSFYPSRESHDLRVHGLPSLGEKPKSLKVEEVTVQLSGTTILDRVSFSIVKGSIVAIVGPSGAGKTTLLKSINGLVTITGGSVNLAGSAKAKPADPDRSRTATIFQEHALIGRLTAMENVLRGLVDRHSPRLAALFWPHSFYCRAANALDQVDMLKHAATPVRQLSGGERQRVAIARALVRDPEVLLADEPFASVDPVLRQTLASLIVANVRAVEMTLVVVLHDLDITLAMADQVIGLRDGRVVFDGPAAAFDVAAYKATYGCSQARLQKPSRHIGLNTPIH